MRTSFQLGRVFGIDIKMHVTFLFLLLLFYFFLGLKGLFLITGVFFFVVIHELSHSLVAMHFGVRVKRITLLPIGGVASMEEMPKNPYQEFLISIAGPLSNILMVVIFFLPLYFLLGEKTLMEPFLAIIGKVSISTDFNVIAHIYWLNLVLAVFNMIPAFPMDGGRVLRSLLCMRMDYKEATKVAVRIGHIFALVFAYIGLIHGHIFLLLIALFIYTAASGESMQVNVFETLKHYKVEDILSRNLIVFYTHSSISEVLEVMLHEHIEDFPVLEDERLAGFITKREIIQGIHFKGKDAHVGEIMRRDIPTVHVKTRLNKVQKLMVKNGTTAMPVENNRKIIGVVTLEDINRIYLMTNEA